VPARRDPPPVGARAALRPPDLTPDEIVHVGGLPVTSPAPTAADSARWAPSREEAVVDVDMLLEARVLEESTLPPP